MALTDVSEPPLGRVAVDSPCRPDAVQIGTALETSSLGVVTHDWDFSSIEALSERVVVYG